MGSLKTFSENMLEYEIFFTKTQNFTKASQKSTPVVLCTVEVPRGEGTAHMKGVGMLVGNFELNP